MEQHDEQGKCAQKHLKMCTDCQGRANLGSTGFATYPVMEKEEPCRLLPEKQTNETPLGQHTQDADKGTFQFALRLEHTHASLNYCGLYPAIRPNNV